MKSHVIIIAILGIFTLNLKAQNLSISNGTLKFSSLKVYEQYAENSLDQSEIVKVTSTISTLANQEPDLGGEDAEDIEPADSLYPDFLKQILNTDKIVTIGNYLVKIDLDNHIGLVITADDPSAYKILLSDDTTARGVIVFSDEDDDAMDVLEAIDTGTMAIADYQAETSLRSRRAKRHKDATFQYWMQFANNRCPDKEYCFKGEDKLVYQKAIFYFSIQAERKSQKECCFDPRVTHNPQRHFVNLKIEGTAKFRKRCRDEQNILYNNEVFNDHKITWRPYSSSRGLSHYDVTVRFFSQEPSAIPNPYVPSREYHIIDGY